MLHWFSSKDVRSLLPILSVNFQPFIVYTHLSQQGWVAVLPLAGQRHCTPYTGCQSIIVIVNTFYTLKVLAEESVGLSKCQGGSSSFASSRKAWTEFQ